LDIESKLNVSQIPLQAILSQTAKNLPEKTAIIQDNQKFTYYEIDQFSSRFAEALAVLDVKKSDRVALFLPNSPQFVIAYFGTLKAGAVVVAVNPLCKKDEVKRQLCDSGAQTIVVLDTLYPIVEVLTEYRIQLKNIIVANLNVYSDTANIKTGADVLIFDTLIKNRPGKQLTLQFDPNEDLAVLQYTGGTTGVSKGVMLTHRNLVSNTCNFSSWLNGTAHDVFLSITPFSHVYGMTTNMLTPIRLGATMVLLSKFDPVKSLQVIEHHRVTVFCGSPTMYAMLLASGKFEKCDLSSVRVCISGASPLPLQIQKRFLQAGVFLVEGYGLTEASPVTHCNPIDKTVNGVKVGSIGVPLGDTEAQIVDLETGSRRLATGEKGELSVRGPQVMRGYWQRPEETAQVLSEDKWLLTGDIAYVDKTGYFFIVDRKKDLIKHKDYSVYPRELEEILYDHPAVGNCAVVGKPDGLVGEIPKAYVVLKEKAKVTSKELLEFVNGKVASYKAIGEIEFCKELPTSPLGKILKRALKP
jgi:long-chain acyl-CoA synthetase